MKVLIVTKEVPYPPNSGGYMRTFHIARELARYAQLDMLCLPEPGEPGDPKGLAAFVHDVAVVERKRQSGPERLRTICRFRPPSTASYEQAEVVAALRQRLAAGAHDIVQFEYPWAGRLIKHVDRTRTRVVVDCHNVEYELLRAAGDAARQSGDTKGAVRFELLWRLVRRFEARVLSAADMVLFTSERDRLLAGALCRSSDCTAVVPNGIAAGDYTCAEPQDRTSDTVVFTGLMSYFPNVDGAEWLCREVMPLVWQERPAVSVLIVGRDPDPRVRALAGNQVTVTGSVPSVADYLKRAAVVAAPVRYGSGTRLKILEAMAVRCPVVSTGKGCEGLDLVAPEHLRVADAPADFARELLDCLSDPVRASEMAARGAEHVRSRYDWPAIVAELWSQYSTLTGK